MRKRRLKVLLLADSRAFHTERIVAEYRSQGLSVFTASLETGRLHHWPLRRLGPIKQTHYFLARHQVKMLIDRLAPDIINAHFASGYGFLAAEANRGRRVPLLLHLWGSDILIVPGKSFLHRRKVTRALRAADHVIADSQYLLDRAHAIAPTAGASVIPWGLERRWFEISNIESALQKPLRIIVPRTHAPVYNNEFIARALRPLLDSHAIEISFPDFGPTVEDFRRLIHDAGISNVRLYPRLGRAGFVRFAVEHDLYLSASRSDSSPASLIEAMGLGLIPVAADIPGVREWLGPGSGLLFAQDDAEALVSLIQGLIRNNDCCRSLRQANRERVHREAIFEDNVAATIAITERLCGR
ncbi:MAG: glycosyltransferase [bacterium]